METVMFLSRYLNLKINSSPTFSKINFCYTSTMQDVTIESVYATEITDKEKKVITDLDAECFADIDPKEIKEDFIAVPFGYITAKREGKLIGKIDLFKTNLLFAGKNMLIGGLGGVCVAESERRKGIASKMCALGLTVLQKEGCDVASLNADLDKQAYKVYQKLGFNFVNRKASFENIKGEIKFVDGTMFMPLGSKEFYDLIMNSKETFHYGKGYW